MEQMKNIVEHFNKSEDRDFSLPTYQRDIWLRFTPGERLRRSWELRRRIKDLKEIHDKKIFPKP